MGIALSLLLHTFLFSPTCLQKNNCICSICIQRISKEVLISTAYSFLNLVLKIDLRYIMGNNYVFIEELLKIVNFKINK